MAVEHKRTGMPQRFSAQLRRATVGVAVVGILGCGTAARTRPVRSPDVRTVSGTPITRVAVLGPDLSAADDPDVTLLAITIRDTIAAQLGARTGIDLVAWDDVDSYVDGIMRDTGHPPWQSAIRAAVGADQLLSIELACSGNNCDITLTRDPAAPRAPLAYRFPLPLHDTGYTRGNLAVYLSTLFPDHPARDTGPTGKTAPQDQARYVQLIKDNWPGSAASSDDVLAEVELLRRAAPRSVEVLLFEANLLRRRDVLAGKVDRMQHAIARLGDADQLTPVTYSALSARFELALAGDGLEDARTLLDQLVQLDPDSSATHFQRARLHYKSGELAAARGELDEATRRAPFSWRVTYYRARVLRDLGDRTATRTAIDQLLAQSPGNRAGLSLLAREELDAGHPACSEQLLEQLRRDPHLGPRPTAPAPAHACAPGVGH
jgi:serine/threonine-protein kinase